jgi:hypothetical protein
VDFDFTTLQPIESSLLQAALAFPGITTSGVSSLRYLLSPLLLGPRFSPISLAKTWAKELKAFKDQEHLSFDDGTDADTYADLSSGFDNSDLGAALVPVLGYSIQSVGSLQYLQSTFQSNPSIENLLALITSEYPLNQKQRVVLRALSLRILHPIRINSVQDQFLLYLSGIGGVGKTHLIKALLMFSLVERFRHLAMNQLLTFTTNMTRNMTRIVNSVGSVLMSTPSVGSGL